MALCNVVEKKWLYRKFLLNIGNSSYSLEYSGWGMGYELVILDGKAIAGGISSPWFIPSFPFNVDEHKVLLNIRVWPWFAIKSLNILIDGQNVYSE